METKTCIRWRMIRTSLGFISLPVALFSNRMVLIQGLQSNILLLAYFLVTFFFLYVFCPAGVIMTLVEL
jgi:hypothetical protein